MKKKYTKTRFQSNSKKLPSVPSQTQHRWLHFPIELQLGFLSQSLTTSEHRIFKKKGRSIGHHARIPRALHLSQTPTGSVAPRHGGESYFCFLLNNFFGVKIIQNRNITHIFRGFSKTRFTKKTDVFTLLNKCNGFEKNEKRMLNHPFLTGDSHKHPPQCATEPKGNGKIPHAANLSTHLSPCPQSGGGEVAERGR